MEKIIINTDGGSRGNPGEGGVGVVISDAKGRIIKTYGEPIGFCTNNEAEYQALILALKKVKALFGKTKLPSLDIEIRSDSELLVKQMNGQYKVLDEKIQPLFLQAWNLKIDFPHIAFIAVPREHNEMANRLVNEALDNAKSAQTLF